MSDEHRTATETRLAEAMASFGRDTAPTDDGWEEVVSGRVMGDRQGPSWRPRVVVAAAAALLVVARGVAATAMGTGDDERSRAGAPGSTEASTTTAAPSTTASVPTDPNAETKACLDGLGVAYRIIQGDGGLGFAPPQPPTEETDRAFTEGVEECRDRLWPPPSEEEQAVNDALGALYVEALVACMDDAGYDVEAVPAGSGAWEIVIPDAQRSSPGFAAANRRCIEAAEQAEREARAELDDG